MGKKIMLLIGLAIICFFGMQSLTFAQGLHEIHAEIQKKGARWQVGDTSMSRLSFAEQQKRLGLVRPKSLRSKIYFFIFYRERRRHEFSFSIK